jgi:serine O-acetyltransferase
MKAHSESFSVRIGSRWPVLDENRSRHGACLRPFIFVAHSRDPQRKSSNLSLNASMTCEIAPIAGVTGKGALAILSSIRLIPLIALMLVSTNRNTVFADLDRWGVLCRLGRPQNLMERIILFVDLMTWKREYRNVFYLRTGMPGKLLSILCTPMSTLHLDAHTKIGPGLFILHGDGVYVTANEIGENCWMAQQVAIGFMYDDLPSIGNNVTIHTGAKVLGKVRVGDNVTIGANSVVIKDVPPNSTVMGVPATVRWGKAP